MKKATAAEATEEELRRAREIFERLQREHRWDFLNIPTPAAKRDTPPAPLARPHDPSPR